MAKYVIMTSRSDNIKRLEMVKEVARVGSLADDIERYLRHLISRSGTGAVEIRRAEVAGYFKCVPSQINYVLETRFSPERGYLVESRRGGGGFIRIIRVRYKSPNDLIKRVLAEVGDRLDESRARHYIELMRDRNVVSQREADIMTAAVRREILRVEVGLRDRLRARVFKAMLLAVAKNKTGEVS